ncbi:MAG: hypothetical protein AAGG50_02295 [Bacteroidota bacterium]
MPVSLPIACLLAALLLAAPGPAFAQEAEGGALLDTWRSQQRDQLEAASGLAFSLGIDRRVEGPGGVLQQRVRAEAGVRVALDAAVRSSAPRFETEVRALEIDGTAVSSEQYGRAAHRLRRLLGPHMTWVERPLTLPYPLLRRASARETTREPYGDRPAWRVALGNLPPGVEEATVWFARDGGAVQLLGSEVRLRLDGRPPPGGPPGGSRPAVGRPDRPPPGPPRGGPADLLGRLVLATDYARLDGLDLPTEQTLDLVAQQRRRLRTFTILVEQRLTIWDVEIER